PLLKSQPCWNRVAVHQPSTTPSIWTIQGCSRGTSSFKYLFAAMQWYFSSCSLDPMHGSGRNLPQCVPLSARTRLCSESATNLLIVR
ncbi:unnamed protein product, partial [Staurois parvus]